MPNSDTPSATKANADSLIAWLREDFFALAMFLALLLIGGDLLAITFGGLTLRLVFPLLMSAAALLYLQQRGAIAFDQTAALLFVMLSIAGALSTLQSYDAVKSMGYTVWVLFDFFIIITLCYNLARQYPPEQTLKFWFAIYRIHVIALLAEIAFRVLTGSIGRPHLWFYEPSYLAIFMTGYFGAALYMLLRTGRPGRLDFGLALVGILATTSATGIFGMIFAVLVNFIVARQRVKLLLGSIVVSGLFLGILYLFFRDTIYYSLIVGFLLQPDVSLNVILERAGNRWIRVLAGWSAFLHHPWLGIGIGGDAAYMQVEGLPESARHLVNEWSGVERGQPFSNIVVEVLGTMGIVGMIPFVSILLYAVWTMIRLMRDSASGAAVALFIGFFSIFFALQFESTFLRYYLWSPLGLALGAASWRFSNAQGGSAPEKPSRPLPASA